MEHKRVEGEHSVAESRHIREEEKHKGAESNEGVKS